MKKGLLIACTLSIFESLYAQKVTTTTPENEWAMYGLPYNGAELYQKYPGYSQFTLTVSPSEKVIPFKEKKDIWGIAKINDHGKVVWQTKIAGEVRGTGKIGDQILAIYVDDYIKTKSITASLFDPSNGKEIQKKIVYQNTTGTRLILKVENKPDGSFHDILVRSTNSKGDVITKMELIFLGPDLTGKTTVLKPSAYGEIFCGSIVNKSGDIFIASASNQTMNCFQYGASGEEKAKLASPLTYSGEYMTSILNLDDENDNTVYLASKYSPKKKDYAFRLFAFDFTGKKASAADEQMLDKGYQKSLKLEHLKGTYSGEAKPIEDLELISIIPYGNKLAVLTEIRTFGIINQNYTTRFYNNAWVLSFYDQNLKLTSATGLDKQFEIFQPLGRSLGYHLNNDHLYVVSTSLTGPLNFTTLFSDVNLSTERIEATQQLDRREIKSSYFIEGDATLWFDKAFLLEYIVPIEKFTGLAAVHCMFQRVEF